jgi:monoamine oxidase
MAIVDKRTDRRTVLRGAALGTAAALVPAKATAATKGAKETRVDVAVVGAGMSGLYAADLLRRAGRSVVILEASPRIGGRVLNLKVGPRAIDVSEAGAQWIAPEQRRIQSLMKRFRLKTFKNFTDGKATLIIDGQILRIDGANIGSLPAAAAQQLVAVFGELTSMAAKVPVDAPWKAPQAEEWDSQTAATWVAGRVSEPLSRSFASVALGGPVSVLPPDISLLHYLFIAAACGGPLSLVSVGSGVLSDRVVGGTGRLAAGLAAPLKSVTKLNSPVTALEHGKRSVRLTTPEGSYVADHAVIAMAPTMTQQILFDPMLPVPRTQSVQRTGMGSAIKCFPVYKKPFWRDKGLSGIVQSNSTPFAAAFDNSPADGSPGVLFALVENVHARRLSGLSPAKRRAEVLDGLALALGDEARKPIRYVEQDWSAEPWIRGGAACFFGPGLLTEYRYLFGTPIGRLHFAGTETGTRFWGNMEAALASGERAAKEIVGG